MRKTHHPSGLLMPEKTSAISVCTETDTSQPPPPKAALDPIANLAEMFEAYQSSGSRVDRERFYQSLWILAEKCARRQLAWMRWKGDIQQDAMDVTAVFCSGLCRQEERRTGLFTSSSRTSAELRGYLNSTIHRGVEELAKKLLAKRRHWLHFEEDAVQAAADSRKTDWLPQVLRLAKALDKVRAGNRDVAPVAVGTTSLDLVLNLDLTHRLPGGEVKKLVSEKGVADRTRQRREQSLRKDLRHEMEM